MRRLICAILCALPATAMAVGTSHWLHTSAADFKSGKFENVVATNLGDLKLSRAVKTILEQDPKVSAVYALAEAQDGTIYAGTGPQGVLLSIKDDKVSTAYTLKDNESIFSLQIDKEGRLLIGTGGEKGRVLRIDKPGADAKEIFAPKDVQYIWAMQETSDGNLYAATGPNGQLFEILPDGSHQVILDSDEHNLLSLLSDGKDTLYIGTDPHGLVYRVNRKTHDAFVLYDAEAEVSALAMDDKGNLYAGTADADAASPEGEPDDTATSDKAGRPEHSTGGLPIPSAPSAEPKPPEMPEPNPGEPAPIPKKNKEQSSLNNQSPEPLKLSDSGQADEPEPGPHKKPKPPGTPLSPGTKPKIPAHLPPISHIKAAEPGPKGNAIYRIDRDGFVTEVFRQPVLVLSILVRDNKLLVGTGNDGTVYQVDASAEETVALAKVDPKQVMTLMAAKDGRIIMGMANVGAVAAMSSGFAAEGTYTSPVLDASQVSRFGKIRLQGTLPENTSLKLSTRSGNVEGTEEKGWSPWTAATPATQFMQIASPAARFFQYRFTMTSDKGQHTPVLDEIDVAYQVPNLAPQIKTVHLAAAPPKGAAAIADAAVENPKTGRGVVNITWEASDPNNDPMLYSIYYRQGSSPQWILLKDKVKESQFDWDTRTVGDGQYFVKILASDEAANPRGTGKTGARVSDPVSIDNTPPVIGDIIWKKGAGSVGVTLRVMDKASTVAGVDYSVDSNDDWQAVLPSDNIFDTPEEDVAFTVANLKPGQHQVTIRATDAHGNQGFESIVVSVDPAK